MPRSKISREDILKICWGVFHRDGYNATSLQTAATAVGLGKAGLLHHFGSKEGLMRAVLGFARESYQAYVLDVAKEEKPLEDRLLKMMRRQAKLASIDQRGCFFANTILETNQERPFQTELKFFLQDWLDAMTEMLTERFPADEARERAYRYFIDYEGSMLLFQLDRDPSHWERLKSRVLEQLELPVKITQP